MKTPSYGFALHTSSSDLGLALSDFVTPPRSQTWALGRDLAAQLQPKLAEFIAPQTWDHVGWLAVAIGPGSFTGTRIGVVAARTLAQQLQLPLYGISSLAAIAWHHYQQWQPTQPMAVQMHAQRGEIFGGIFQGSPEGLTVLQSDQVLTPQVWQAQLNADPTMPQLILAEGELGYSATAILELADQHWKRGDRPQWETVVPFYGQHPVE